MKPIPYTLLTAALLANASLALAGAPDVPAPAGRDGTSMDRQRPGTVDTRERPGDTRSRYPETGIDKGPATTNDMSPPANGSSMDMNDSTNNINDSTLEMPRPNSNTR